MSDLWLTTFEQVLEFLQDGKIDESEATGRLRALGLDQPEIAYHLKTVNE